MSLRKTSAPDTLQSRCAPVAGHLAIAPVQPAADRSSVCPAGNRRWQSSSMLSTKRSASLLVTNSRRVSRDASLGNPRKMSGLSKGRHIHEAQRPFASDSKSATLRRADSSRRRDSGGSSRTDDFVSHAAATRPPLLCRPDSPLGLRIV